MQIAILGRQPTIGIAELEGQYGANVSWLSSTAARIDQTEPLDVTRFGGSLKVGTVIQTFSHHDWKRISHFISSHFEKTWRAVDYKVTLGISLYDIAASARDIQRTGLILKKNLKRHNVSLRLIPNQETALSTATSHHNKLGLSDNKVELLVVKTASGGAVIAQSTGAQNITAYAARDQQRPKRDAFVGMLPPKLAQIMLNLTLEPNDSHLRVLDPFCGTGVVLQEAALRGNTVYGSDLSQKMIDYTAANLDWLEKTHHVTVTSELMAADATSTQWSQPIGAVVCEGYLGQPFSAPPAADKLRSVMRTCDGIMSDFLKNIATQLTPGTPLCVAVPAWQDDKGQFSHLSLIKNVRALGYERVAFKTVSHSQLLYYREDQVVARELLVLRKL